MNNIFKSKLILGTAQFGMPYGLEDYNKIIKVNKLNEILKYAKKNGINRIDTAINYGDIQQKLGKIGVKDFLIVSKIPKLKHQSNINKFINNSVNEILNHLEIKKIFGVLMHSPEDLLSQNGMNYYKVLLQCKKAGFIKKIGISIHNFDHIKIILDKYKFDIVQLPFNIFDQRLLKYNIITYLKKKNVELHVRSIFLQGLLLMKPEIRPKMFTNFETHLNLWDEWIKQNNITRLEACLNFVNSIDFVKGIVVGIKSLTQFEEILSVKPTKFNLNTIKLANNELKLIDPSKWK